MSWVRSSLEEWLCGRASAGQRCSSLEMCKGGAGAACDRGDAVRVVARGTTFQLRTESSFALLCQCQGRNKWVEGAVLCICAGDVQAQQETVVPQFQSLHSIPEVVCPAVSIPEGNTWVEGAFFFLELCRLLCRRSRDCGDAVSVIALGSNLPANQQQYRGLSLARGWCSCGCMESLAIRRHESVRQICQGTFAALHLTLRRVERMTFALA